MKRKEGPIEYNYRGRRVQVDPPSRLRNGQNTLMIDETRVPYTQTDEGVYSHAMMFQVFGSPYELAEAIIQDWGTSEINLNSLQEHDHEEGGEGGGHNHGDHDHNQGDHDHT